MNTPLQKTWKPETKAEEVGRDIPKNAENTAPFAEKIQHRAETITPMLQQILEYRPSPHWGISD
ncbi:MAG: hypothetical protein ACLQSR_07785 [Limisphaerales bacterium]